MGKEEEEEEEEVKLRGWLTSSLDTVYLNDGTTNT